MSSLAPRRVCAKCGYDLAGVSKPPCPECGDNAAVWVVSRAPGPSIIRAMFHVAVGVVEYIMLARAAGDDPLSLFLMMQWYPLAACGVAFALEWGNWDSLRHYNSKTNLAGSTTLQTFCWLLVFARVLIFVFLVAIVRIH